MKVEVTNENQDINKKIFINMNDFMDFYLNLMTKRNKFRTQYSADFKIKLLARNNFYFAHVN